MTNSRNVFDNQHVSIDTIKELSRTTPAAGKPQVCAQFQIVAQVSEWNQFLSSGPEDCEPSVDREGFEKGGVGVEVESVYVLSLGPEDCELLVDPEVFGRGGVEVESEYDLELRIGGNLGRLGMRHSSLLTVQMVRW